jgi:hypothetical protein
LPCLRARSSLLHSDEIDDAGTRSLLEVWHPDMVKFLEEDDNWNCLQFISDFGGRTPLSLASAAPTMSGAYSRAGSGPPDWSALLNYKRSF